MSTETARDIRESRRSLCNAIELIGNQILIRVERRGQLAGRRLNLPPEGRTKRMLKLSEARYPRVDIPKGGCRETRFAGVARAADGQ
jgi:hypothetical protein